MKRLVLVSAMALIVSPSFALTLGLVDNGNGTVSLTYSGASTANLPRAFALTVTIDGGAQITAVTPAITGVSTAANQGYGIFPGTIDINSSGIVQAYGSPLALEGDLGAGDQIMPSNNFVIELGSMYAPHTSGIDVNEPLTSGTLATFAVDCGIAIGNVNISVSEEDTYRGGVILEDSTKPSPALTASLVFDCTTITEAITTPTVNKTTAAPAIAGRVNAVRSESFLASGVASNLGHTLEYKFTWGDGTDTGWVSGTTQNKMFTTATTKTWTTNVTVQARCAADIAVVSAVSAPIAETGEAVKSTATFYATWADFSRPNCWAYQRNCRGDADGLGGGIGVNKIWVNAADLNVLSAGFNKIVAALKLASYGGVPAVCADTDRAGSGIGVNKIWVNSTDLGKFTLYFGKIMTNIPVCDAAWQSNYNYWTN